MTELTEEQREEITEILKTDKTVLMKELAIKYNVKIGVIYRINDKIKAPAPQPSSYDPLHLVFGVSKQ